MGARVVVCVGVCVSECVVCGLKGAGRIQYGGVL